MLTLAMLVKNEASSIEASIRSCSSVANRVVLLDTGSTDDTLRIARETCAELGIEIDVHEESFVDFATSRNRCLELAEPTNEFVLMLSGDETLLNGAVLAKRGAALKDEAFAGYLLPVTLGASRFGSVRLFRSSAKARFVGPVHEYVDIQASSRGRIDDVIVHHDLRGRDQARAAARFRDVDLPLLLAEVEKPDCSGRWFFYLAQTYACLGENENALRWYRRRIEVGGWHEETYESQFRIAGLLTDRDEKIEAYKKAHELSPHRAEPLVELAQLFRDRDWPRSFAYALDAYYRPMPSDILFVDSEVYAWRAAAVLGIAAWYAGHHAIGREATRKALTQRPDIAYLQGNMRLYDGTPDPRLVNLATDSMRRFDGGLPFDHGYGSHAPVLSALLVRSPEGPVIEFGAGFGSTPMLHATCVSRGVRLYTADSERSWLETFEKRLAGPLHSFHHVPDWLAWDGPDLEPFWWIAFVDNGPAETRVANILRVANKAKYVVVHDTNMPGFYGYDAIEAHFKFRRVSKLLDPWTTIYSNFTDDLPSLNGVSR